MSTRQDTTPTTRTRRVSLWLTIVLVVAAIGAGGLIGMLAASGDEAPETPQTVTFGGTFTLEDDDGITVDGSRCFGDEGYDDISTGTQVTVYDRSGKVLAIGDLGPGLVKDGYWADTCVFSILVEKVPAGRGLYQIEVSHRGKIAFSEAKGLAGDITLSLG